MRNPSMLDAKVGDLVVRDRGYEAVLVTIRGIHDGICFTDGGVEFSLDNGRTVRSSLGGFIRYPGPGEVEYLRARDEEALTRYQALEPLTLWGTIRAYFRRRRALKTLRLETVNL